MADTCDEQDMGDRTAGKFVGWPASPFSILVEVHADISYPFLVMQMGS